ncbi:MAG TPA: lipocalin-like domain-containing protein, partial [Candidatus Limnocylindrales bacterium]|nr:lipocalin-like domain-containing protein [Candidatus Limnocylindrales bacterium]
MRRGLARLAAFALVAAACTGPGGPILANPSAPRPSAPAPSVLPSSPPDPQPVVFPRDDGPHDRLTEWWYVTGHLVTADGAGPERRFGFEYVIFRAERGDFPPAWASHLAITDETGDAFHYAQRQEIGPGVDRSPRGVTGELVGFDLSLSGLDPTDPTT